MNAVIPESFIKDINQTMSESMQRPLHFLLAGRTGVGKSSTINSLLGKDIAPTSDSNPTTFEVTAYQAEIGGIAFTVTDTPGLCDELPEVGNDEKYLALIRAKVREIDCFWYVARLDEARLSSDERRSIKLISQSLGSEIWKHAILVFTHANAADNFEEALKIRTKLLKNEIEKYLPRTNFHLPAVAVENKNPTLSDGTLWLPELFSITTEQLRSGGVTSFVISAAERLTDAYTPTGNASDIPLNGCQRERVNDAIEKENGSLSKIIAWVKENGHNILDLAEILGPIFHERVGPIIAVISKIIRPALGQRES